MGCNELCVRRSHTAQRVAACQHLNEAFASSRDDPEAGANRQPSYLAKESEVPAEGLDRCILVPTGQGCISVCISYAVSKHIWHLRNLIPRRI